MDFDAALAKLQNPGEGEQLDTVYDDLRQTWQERQHEIEIRDAKITEESTRAQKLAEEVAKLKARNYDLMVATPATPSDDPQVKEDDEPKGVARLFGRK